MGFISYPEIFKTQFIFGMTCRTNPESLMLSHGRALLGHKARRGQGEQSSVRAERGDAAWERC